MNLESLKNSTFLKLGKSRYDYVNDQFIQRVTAMFNIGAVDAITQEQTNNLSSDPSEFNKQGNTIPLVHLRDALEINHSRFLSNDIRLEICKQWMEVDKIIKNIGLRNPIARLIVQEPGTTVPTHKHFCPMILTFSFRFTENSSQVYDKSGIGIGKEQVKIIEYPDSDKCFFAFYDDPFHSSISNEWRFHWHYDFEEKIQLPKNTGFTYLPF
jgi:hypothetical protein